MAVWNPGKAFDQAYPPGSTAKLVASAAALEENVVSPTDEIFCHRTPELLGEAYHCSHPPPRGPYTLSTALAYSCNYFFSALSQRLAPSQLAHWYTAFGFGIPVQGVGSSRIAGLVQVGDRPVDKALATLGEGSILATPAQLLQAYMAIANRGPVYQLWRERTDRQRASSAIRTVKLRASTFELLNSALVNCVERGTGHAAVVPSFQVAGKTGTATVGHGGKATHAWFVGYAPAQNPSIILVIFLERGMGARDAAPLAGKIFRDYLLEKDTKK